MLNTLLALLAVVVVIGRPRRLPACAAAFPAPTRPVPAQSPANPHHSRIILLRHPADGPRCVPAHRW